MSALCHKQTPASQQFCRYSIPSRPAKQRKRYGKASAVFGRIWKRIPIDENFKFDAAQQVLAIAGFGFVCFILVTP
jgi:hypothetical protein